MAKVNLRLRSGPLDGQTTTMDVSDVDNPPESYTARAHGPHEIVERFTYHRVGREPDGQADGAIWIYESSDPRH